MKRLCLLFLGFLICLTYLQAEEKRTRLEVSLFELPIKLDPHQTDSSNEMFVTLQMFEGLVRFKSTPSSLEIEPALANSWEASKDAKRYTFHLRKNVKFHDGTPFNAEAVRFNILRQIDPEHPHYLKDAFYYADMTYGMVETVKVLDAYTVQINLKYSYSPFIANLAMPLGAPMVSPASIQKHDRGSASHPVGTGPFRYASRNEKQIVLERNPDHWEKAQGVESIRFKSEANENTRMIALRNGSADVMLEGSYAIAQKLQRDENFQVFRTPSLHIAYLSMNTEKTPLNDVRVRQAINHAINKPALVKLVMGESAVPAKNPIPPGVTGYNDSIVDYSYDVDKAKSLLKETGYDKGFETILRYRGNIKTHAQIASYIKAALGKIGINLKLQPMQWSEMRDAIGSGDNEIAIVRWFGDNGDADNFFYPLLSKESAKIPNALNNAFYQSDEAEKLIQAGRSETYLDKRIEIYRKLQEIIHQDAPWVPLYHSDNFYFSISNIKGVASNMLGEVRFQHAKFTE